MTDEKRDPTAREDARARDSATRDVERHVWDDEVVEAELVEDEEPSTGPDSGENGAADQVEISTSSPRPSASATGTRLARRTKADQELPQTGRQENSEALARGKADLARQMLPALDNLERALAAGEDPSAHPALVQGVGMVRDELRSRLEGAGVESFDPTGEKFDPQLHEALSTRPDEGTEPGVVLETVEKGYRLNGQVLRPARVVVSA
jgi:molecular chaperone GrpE